MNESTVLNLYPIDYPFETLVSRVENNKLKLNPEFQRKYKWNKNGEEKTSKFIESCLMRIPLPACYFAENEDKTHIVIDGVQRITTIQRFMNDEFELEGLTQFEQLNGKIFSQLGDYQNDIETYTIRCIVLRKDNDRRLVKDIFSRLNQGAVELTSQEIRNAIYPGSLNDLLNELALNKIIKDFKNNKEKDGLEAQEQVLRFLALDNDLSDYDGRLTKHLDNYMYQNAEMSIDLIQLKKKNFNDAIKKCEHIFGQSRIFTDLNNTRATQSISYYDLLMWSLKDVEWDVIKDKKEMIYEGFKELCIDPEFKKKMSGGTQTKTSMIARRNMWKRHLENII